LLDGGDGILFVELCKQIAERGSSKSDNRKREAFAVSRYKCSGFQETLHSRGPSLTLTYFDRTPRSHKLGFTAVDVKTVTAIFVSHARFDHISDIGNPWCCL
jgi:hypothetical protein